MLQCVLNEDHLSSAVSEVLRLCRHRLVIATANVKNLYVPDKARGMGGQGARSILDVFEEMSERNIEIRLLHSGVPSGPFMERLERHVPRMLIPMCIGTAPAFTSRR